LPAELNTGDTQVLTAATLITVVNILNNNIDGVENCQAPHATVAFVDEEILSPTRDQYAGHRTCI
jgi:hypothetical protein